MRVRKNHKKKSRLSQVVRKRKRSWYPRPRNHRGVAVRQQVVPLGGVDVTSNKRDLQESVVARIVKIQTTGV